MPNETATRLTLEQIHLLVPRDNRGGEYQCPKCHKWHLRIENLNCFSDVCNGACASEIAALIWAEVHRRENKPKQTEGPVTLGGPLTVKECAAARRLPEAELQGTWHLVDGEYKGAAAVVVPWDAELVQYHGTKSATNQHNKLFPFGSKVKTLYGLEVLRNQFLALSMLEGGYANVPPFLFILEGAPDVWTLMHNFLPALGSPQQMMWKPEWNDEPLINEAQLIFNIQEPDDASLPRDQWTWAKADKWTKKIADNLPGKEVRAVRLPAKDANQLWLDLWADHGELGEDVIRPLFYNEVMAACKRESSILVSQPFNQDESLPSPEMPETVLCGRLGELLTKNLANLPRAYAWLSLVAVAGILVPLSDEKTALYVANVGPSGSGKGMAIEHSLKLLGIRIGEPEENPLVFTDQAGSFEGLAAHSIGERHGAQCLWFQPELSITLDKSKIDGASFAPALCGLYDFDRFALTVKRDRTIVNARLTMAGGLIEGSFADVFGGRAGDGLYQRFLFGLQKTNIWIDPEYTGQLITRPDLAPVKVTGSAREAINAFAREHAGADHVGRIMQNILRVAVICAAWDGKAELTADDMAPHLALADYQIKVCLILRPDPGRNQQAQVGNRIMSYVQQHTGDILVRKMDGDRNISKEFGSGMRDQVIRQLEAAGEIEVVSKRPFVIRGKQN